MEIDFFRPQSPLLHHPFSAIRNHHHRRPWLRIIAIRLDSIIRPSTLRLGINNVAKISEQQIVANPICFDTQSFNDKRHQFIPIATSRDSPAFRTYSLICTCGSFNRINSEPPPRRNPPQSRNRNCTEPHEISDTPKNSTHHVAGNRLRCRNPVFQSTHTGYPK